MLLKTLTIPSLSNETNGKVTHVSAIALALITPSRTYRPGIEMPSSLFDCRTFIFVHPHNGGLHFTWPLKREVDKVTHVSAIALALITPSRTFRPGIEMPSSLFDCRKKKQSKTKLKQTSRQTKKRL